MIINITSFLYLKRATWYKGSDFASMGVLCESKSTKMQYSMMTMVNKYSIWMGGTKKGKIVVATIQKTENTKVSQWKYVVNGKSAIFLMWVSHYVAENIGDQRVTVPKPLCVSVSACNSYKTIDFSFVRRLSLSLKATNIFSSGILLSNKTHVHNRKSIIC